MTDEPLLRPRLDFTTEIAMTSESRRGFANAVNEDACLNLGSRAVLAVADGAGRAGGAAHRAVDLLARLLELEPVSEVERFGSWRGWFSVLDSILLGTGQSTLAALAFRNGRVVGASVGDSRVMKLDREGRLVALDETSRHRLGTGRADPRPIHAPVEPGECVLLMTDGAWPGSGAEGVRRTLARQLTASVFQTPTAMLDEAERTGGVDDMTVAVARVTRSAVEAPDWFEIPEIGVAVN